jgi:far upstream element-binding protein
VSSIIQGGGDHYGGGGTAMEEQIGVPNGVVGFIIGRGGESIASMQSRTGCKVQIQKENEMNPGQTQRVITLQASTKEAIDQCRSIIQGMVNERTQTSSRDSFSGGGGGGGGSSQEARTKEAVQAGHVLVTVAVPDTDVGLIIGKAGSTIKGIQDRSGANIQIPQSGDANNPSIRTVSITHPHGEGANLAKQLIEDILGSKKNQAPQITIQVEVSWHLHCCFCFIFDSKLTSPPDSL